MLDGIIKGKRAAPRRCLLYGTHGIGKSTWAAQSPAPIVIATEDGLDDVGIDRTPTLKKTIDVAKWLIELSGEEQHNYKTVVIDSLDWLEKLIWTATAEEAGKKSVDDIPYGRGYTMANKRWDQLLNMLDLCRGKGMNVILLAHAKIERFSPPDGDPYDRWMPDLHKAAAPLLQEWADEVFFASYRISTISKDEGFGHTRTRAIGNGDRVVHTREAPTHAAKRRIEMPDVIPLEFSAYEDAWPSRNGKANIGGIVKDGHSKQSGGEK